MNKYTIKYGDSTSWLGTITIITDSRAEAIIQFYSICPGYFVLECTRYDEDI